MTIRFATLAVLLAGLHSPAFSQALEDQTVHQRFACLQREKALDPLPEKTQDNLSNGLLRFKLRFTAADKPPRVELLHGVADSDMERVARRYLSGYRVPCLHAGDHPIEVVQEFSFSRWGDEPAVPLLSAASRMRFYMPKNVPSLTTWDVGMALVEYSFVDGREAPDVRYVFSSVGRDAKDVIEGYAKQVRLLDSGGQPRPITVRHSWHFRGGDGEGADLRLRQDEYKLLEFLRLVSNVRDHIVDLDLDSMQCPFAVRMNLRQPYEANEVREIETLNPNRAYLLNWLSKLQLHFKNEEQQIGLFGSDVRISIPCGRLNLTALKKPAATPP